MGNNSQRFSRRAVLKNLGAVGLVSTVASTSAFAAPGARSGEVSVGEARTVAARRSSELAARPEFDAWSDASLGKPTTYYMPGESKSADYERSAYVFPVQDGAENLGYVTVSARYEWSPVLEYSRASPPSAGLADAREKATAAGLAPTGRLLYTGSLSYAVEVEGGRRVEFVGRRITKAPESFAPGAMEMAQRDTSRRWEQLTSEDAGTSGSDGVSTMASASISGVPSFTETSSSDKSGSTSYPDCVGTEDDPWDNWDGCIPYAAANVLGYHENISNSDWSDREALIDRMHEGMNTSDDGWTEWSDIAPAINNYSHGTHSYDANTTTWLTPSDMKKNVNNDNPVILNMNDGGGKGDKDGEDYGDHSVAVVGYDERSDGTYWSVHDGWHTDARWLEGGNWEIAKPTYVHKS